MLKKSASIVLAALRGSANDKEYAEPLRSLRPRWTDCLNILSCFCFSFGASTSLIIAEIET